MEVYRNIMVEWYNGILGKYYDNVTVYVDKHSGSDDVYSIGIPLEYIKIFNKVGLPEVDIINIVGDKLYFNSINNIHEICDKCSELFKNELLYTHGVKSLLVATDNSHITIKRAIYYGDMVYLVKDGTWVIDNNELVRSTKYYLQNTERVKNSNILGFSEELENELLELQKTIVNQVAVYIGLFNEVSVNNTLDLKHRSISWYAIILGG